MPIITFKEIIVPGNKRKDGTYPVKIRVTFKGKSRRLPTTLVCYPKDITKSLKIKSDDIKDKASVIIRQMREAIKDISLFDLEDRDVDWVVRQIKDKLKNDSFCLDFFTFGEEYILTKSPSTRRAYSGALNALERFLGERHIDINDITKSLLLEFMEFIDKERKIVYDPSSGCYYESEKEKIAKGASSRHLMKLGHIFNAAKEKFNDEDSGSIVIPRSPFSGIKKVFPASDGQKNLGRELMQKIISYQTDNYVIRTALDAFIASFCLMGANLADMYEAHPFRGEVWKYNRIKTMTRRADKAEMRVRLQPELQPFLKRLTSGEGKGWWLSLLHDYSYKRDFCTIRVNKGLRKWCEENGEEVFTFYAARHTWASLARRVGVEKALVDECLGHIGDYDMADIYAERSWELMESANRKVLDLFDWL